MTTIINIYFVFIQKRGKRWLVWRKSCILTLLACYPQRSEINQNGSKIDWNVNFVFADVAIYALFVRTSLIAEIPTAYLMQSISCLAQTRQRGPHQCIKLIDDVSCERSVTEWGENGNRYVSLRQEMELTCTWWRISCGMCKLSLATITHALGPHAGVGQI